jgi:hypothetical protein
MIMATTTITIFVDAEAAKAFGAASPGVQQKIHLLLSLRLQDLTAAHAEATGLTPAILETAILETLLHDK